MNGAGAEVGSGAGAADGDGGGDGDGITLVLKGFPPFLHDQRYGDNIESTKPTIDHNPC